MTFRRRLGVLTIVASGLLVAGLLLSAPAFAWSASVKIHEAACPPGSDKVAVKGSVTLSKEGQPGHVVIKYQVGDSGVLTQVTDQNFVADQTNVDFSFTVDSPDSDNTKLTVSAQAFFENNTENPTGSDTVYIDKCKGEETTSTTEAPPTSETPTTSEASTSTNEAPATTAAPTTTVVAGLGGETSTSGEGALPFTGSNPLPMLIGALVLVLGGGSLLVASKLRARQVK